MPEAMAEPINYSGGSSEQEDKPVLADRGGPTWNFDFKVTTLDEGQLLAIRARHDALSRVNRIDY